MKEGDLLNIQLTKVAEDFLEYSKNKEILVISHFDTDGITSAAIITKTLKKLDKKFSVQIIKSISREFIYTLPKNKIIIFLDLASGSLNHLANTKIEKVFIIDHHEIIQEIPKNVKIINPELTNKEKISSSGLTYLFCKEINKENKDSAKLAILGMIGDTLEKEIDKLNHNIINEGEIKKRRGALIYPATRPLNRVLEFSASPFIPGVTGNISGVLELLRDSGISPNEKGYPSLLELNDEEMEKLVTSILLRNPKAKNNEIVGDIYLIKLYNKLEDARELSAKINACSRLGDPNTALQFCLEISDAKKKAESIHVKYRQHIVSALKYVSENTPIQGKGYTIINAKEKIKDTIIGTIASIISNSKLHEEGTTIITMAYTQEQKVKISARNVGDTGRNVRDLLHQVTINLEGGEVGGHEFAAGCLIHKEHENKFLEELQKNLEVEMIKF